MYEAIQNGTPAVKPISFTVKPISVSILTKERQVSADKRYEIECKTTGSRPEATVTWWKNNRQLKRMAKNVRPLCHCPLINRFFSIPLSLSDRVSLLSVGYFFFRKTFLILVCSMLYFYFTFVVLIVWFLFLSLSGLMVCVLITILFYHSLKITCFFLL